MNQGPLRITRSYNLGIIIWLEDELTKQTIYSDISLVNYNFSSDLKFCLKNESFEFIKW